MSVPLRPGSDSFHWNLTKSSSFLRQTEQLMTSHSVVLWWNWVGDISSLFQSINVTARWRSSQQGGISRKSRWGSWQSWEEGWALTNLTMCCLLQERELARASPWAHAPTWHNPEPTGPGKAGQIMVWWDVELQVFRLNGWLMAGSWSAWHLHANLAGVHHRLSQGLSAPPWPHLAGICTPRRSTGISMQEPCTPCQGDSQQRWPQVGGEKHCSFGGSQRNWRAFPYALVSSSGSL